MIYEEIPVVDTARVVSAAEMSREIVTPPSLGNKADNTHYSYHLDKSISWGIIFDSDRDITVDIRL